MTSTPAEPSYSEATASLEAMGASVKNLINSLLRDGGIMARDVQSRVKSAESVAGKLERNPEKYSGPASLTDLLGIRITTYFSDDVDRIAELFVREFEVDADNSVDKRASLAPEAFGYLSLHYVATLGPGRAEMVEYKDFAGKKFELQIRSVLQDAWAEIEHDLGYKTAEALPRDLRRRFSRLAGLLEIADIEFASLKADLEKRASEVGERVANDDESSSLELDQTTVIAFIDSDAALSEIENQIAQGWDLSLATEVDNRYAAARAAGLRDAGLRTLKDLREALASNGAFLPEFAKVWLASFGSTVNRRDLPKGIGLFYLQLALEASAPLEELQSRARFSKHPGVAEQLIETWREVNPR